MKICRRERQALTHMVRNLRIDDIEPAKPNGYRAPKPHNVLVAERRQAAEMIENLLTKGQG